MEFTTDQVLALAPDSGSAAAGKKLASGRDWQSTGRSPAALWGECQGSALYQVRIDLRGPSFSCSCPSRKFPCKHGLGLLLLWVGNPAAVAESEPPDWVAEWLSKRVARAEQQAARASAPPRESDEVGDPVAQAKRAERRAQQVRKGIDALDLWLRDLARNGLAEVETRPASFWEDQARRLVDAQAPGLAARVRRLAGIPHSGRDWPERLLAELGRLALLTHAYRRLDALDPALQSEVRQLVGWNIGQEEVTTQGERVADDWVVLGQWVESEERLRVQRSWLRGRRSGRSALLLQFSAGGAPFGDSLLPGAEIEAELAYWPGASPQRALIAERRGVPRALTGALPGSDSLEAFLAEVAAHLQRQPWMERFPCALCRIVPVCGGEEQWRVQDRSGAALPLLRGEHWRLLALSGGQPVDLAGEWDGQCLRPLGVVVGGLYRSVSAA